LASACGSSIEAFDRSGIYLQSRARSAPQNAHIRFSTDNVPKEILPCILSLNAVLDRLEHGLERQREFNANAAHQLRTPLAVLSANVQSLDDPAAIERLKIDVDHMTRIVSQLLLTAQLDNSMIDFDEVVDLNEIVADVSANLGPSAVTPSC
jgi:signal transduction histidine kinase